MIQKTFQPGPEPIPAIINSSEPHMALIFVLDVSYSMDGPPINQLNAGLNRFKAEVCQNKQTRDILDVAIIEFNDSFEVVQNFVPIEYMSHMQLECGGGTKYTGAVREALRMAEERSRFYKRSGTEPFKPWVIMVTDGAPLDDITQLANEVRAAQSSDKLRFIALGVGDYDPRALALMTDVVFRMEGTDFTSFFDWVNKSMRSVSVTAPGDKPKLPSLEGNIYRDVSDI